VRENEINGQLDLHLADQSLRLTGRLHSNQFELGTFDTTFKITGPMDKLAVESFNLQLGTPQTAKITLNGAIRDLRGLQGVNIPQLKGISRKDDLGPLKIRATLLGSKERLELQNLDVRLGRKAFAQVQIQGSVKGLLNKPTVQLDFDIQGDDLANLEVLGLPVSGFYGSFGKRDALSRNADYLLCLGSYVKSCSLSFPYWNCTTVQTHEKTAHRLCYRL